MLIVPHDNRSNRLQRLELGDEDHTAKPFDTDFVQGVSKKAGAEGMNHNVAMMTASASLPSAPRRSRPIATSRIVFRQCLPA
jgi:hypothetical protein